MADPAVKLTPTHERDRAALRVLAACGGGFTAGHIACECGWCSRSEMAVFRTSVIDHLFKVGLIDKIDSEKPAMYVITNEGRALLDALKDEGEATHGA